MHALKTIEAKSEIQQIYPSEAISKANSVVEILTATELLSYPGEEKYHFETQEIHQRKRQQAGTNALKKLVKHLIGSSVTFQRTNITSKYEFARLCQCIFSPTLPNGTYSIISLKSYFEALKAIGSLSPLPESLINMTIIPFLHNIQLLLMNNRNENLLTPSLISGAEWACRYYIYTN